MMAILTGKNIGFAYTAAGDRILAGLDFRIDKGDFIGIAGSSGSGKTTLIKHFNGLLAPDSGEICYRGQNIHGRQFPLADLRQKVGLVFQYPENQLFETTVLKDVMFGPKMLGCPAAEAEARALASLAVMEVEAALHHRHPFELSGGQQRRVAIAGVLAMQPEVLVLDEPAAGLDPRSRQNLYQLLTHLNRDHELAIVLVSHHMEDLAQYANQVWVLDQGKIALAGTPAEVFAQVAFLREIGVGVPQVTHIAAELQRHDFPLAAGLPVSVAAARDMILAVFREQGGGSHGA